MPTLVDAFQSGAHSLSTVEQVIQVVSNDTTNATTPGYASQTPVLTADYFSLSGGGAGGVSLGAVQSSRDPYAEQNVQSAQNAENYSATLAAHLSTVEGIFPLATGSTSGGGIGGSINQFFSSISNLTTNPNNAANRQVVLDAAGNLVASFNNASNAVDSTKANVVSQGQQDVDAINTIVSQIQQINLAKQKSPSGRSDPGMDAQLYSDLEQLSQLTSITTAENNDGTTNIYLGGQNALLLGTTQNKLTSKTVGTSPSVTAFQVQDSYGKDVTSLVTGGKLGALVQLANTTLPGYKEQLNTLAQGLADAVNSTLTSGIDQNGNQGVALFTGSTAKTLAVTGITTSQLAAAVSTNPGGGDNASSLYALSGASQASLGGTTFTTFYGNIAAAVGSDSANAQGAQATERQVLSQAQILRSNLSAVSLDNEAARLTEYQQAYNATSKLLSVVDQMMKTVLSIIPGGGA